MKKTFTNFINRYHWLNNSMKALLSLKTSVQPVALNRKRCHNIIVKAIIDF
ncbi:hypothetical protein FD42_GL000547 [Lentilactobacillus hilgardii DSM 20176 = ATCC 8290]|uniref:Uncharacterized protein n=1 Tax=Lentilactobacillus hilgardii (strain ATCC 8290 / DSM 20176 / CCUG 30140 / JCM 1155 / KCTC 3500 / NBRC 15886 / NCIMB 8040 / NRRL B-1843 / 9) TaxID=1423757 RepID=C0XI17_LENH9|nr:hypothetical protein [Lentilactobacillus hilgardii]EEI24955.1 hypothetical protein HMPREF0519_0878 [Lentilactobacillus hilgardii DSM 20176 = ATCC 8290]KRK56379.1 hypothetical protein FD42_GL000547 [Lentilactobacillus hilgardii DSM 20176 = ATCC 8290]